MSPGSQPLHRIASCLLQITRLVVERANNEAKKITSSATGQRVRPQRGSRVRRRCGVVQRLPRGIHPPPAEVSRRLRRNNVLEFSC